MDKKQRVGYRTSATELEDEFAEINKLLDAKKVEWDEIRKSAIEGLYKWMREFETREKSGCSSPGELQLLGRFMEYWRIVNIIARLGVDITNIHERLVNVEKSVKDLNLSIKRI